MAPDESKQWLVELTQNIISQLKESKIDRVAIWEALGKNKDQHTSCREGVLGKVNDLEKQVLEKFANLDKRIDIAMVKIGAIISALTMIGQAIVNYLGK